MRGNEKANPDIVNILLQNLVDGVLTDSLGNQIDFSVQIDDADPDCRP